jgi:hypothetical protein
MSGDGIIRASDLEPPDQPRKRGLIPPLPDRDAPFSVLRGWVSDAIGLPPTVRVETVVRHGRDDEDSLTISLSNDLVLRCNRQKRLMSPGPFSAFFASESDGLCQPKYLGRGEVADVFVALCRLGTAEAKATEVDILRERLDMFVEMCDVFPASLSGPDRYITISHLRTRRAYDPHAPATSPVLVVDDKVGKRYIRTVEFVAYLRVIHGQTVNEATLPSRMHEAGCPRQALQAWDIGRHKKVAMVFFELAPDGDTP